MLLMLVIIYNIKDTEIKNMKIPDVTQTAIALINL